MGTMPRDFRGSMENSSSPYIPASRVLPEITPLAILLGVVLAAVLGAANAYLGLFAGMTVSASIPAAVISMAVLRMLRTGNILQNNAIQTAASAGESLAAGAIFTLPALLLLGVWNDFHLWETLMLTGFGGLLGVLFTVPLRRALIVDQPLQFPEGVATAEVLKVGEEGSTSGGGAGIRHLVVAGVIGALFKLGSTGLHLWKEAAAWATAKGGWTFYAGTNLSPALVAVGYIVGLNIAILIFLGGAVNWLVAIPAYVVSQDIPISADTALDVAGGIWSAKTRYLGVGAMVVGGLWALIRLSGSLVSGIRSSFDAYKAAADSGGEVVRTERDTPMKLVMLLAAASVVPLFFIFNHFTHSVGIAAFMAVFMVIAGFLFSAVAAYMAGLVGSSNNPISGVTIATILTASLLLKALGISAALGPAAAIFIGSVVCCAAAIGGDNMQDLKAGYLLGSTPVKQQIMQVIGVMAAALAISPVLNLLHEAYVIGSKSMSAPQAALMNAVSAGVFSGNLPWGIIGIGAGIAVVVIAIDLVLESRQSTFRMPVLAFAVGIYLPFELSVPIFIGGLIALFASKTYARDNVPETESKNRARNGLLFGAGLITGEAMVGIAMAVPIIISGDKEVLKVFDGEPSALPGLALLGLVGYLLYRAAIGRTKA